ncbi:MAG: hypothetical protein RQ729_11305 [Wenzhouxiangellaceae bacterium]|nr:hypothetical protein [Wenzhouxiangellaceae bacterium]
MPKRSPARAVGLATTLVGERVRVQLRIAAEGNLSAQLAELRRVLLQEAGRRLDGGAADSGRSIPMPAAGDGPSWLWLDEGVTALEIAAVLRALTRLAAGVVSGDEDRTRWVRALEAYLDDRERIECWSPSGWLLLAGEGSALSERLCGTGIVCDADYRRLESELPAALRLELARLRLDFGVQASGLRPFGQPVFPQRLQAALPPWIERCAARRRERGPEAEDGLEEALEDLWQLVESPIGGAQTRASNAQQRKRLKRIHRRLGARAPALLWEDMAGLPLCGDAPIALEVFPSFRSLLAWLLGQLGESDIEQARDILASRIGEPSISPYHTQQQLAARLPQAIPGSTGGRERVVRLQSNALRFLRAMPAVAGLLERLDRDARRALDQGGGSIALGPACPVRALAGDPDAVVRFLGLFFRDQRMPVYGHSEDGVGLIRLVDRPDRSALVAELLGILHAGRLPRERRRAALEPAFNAIVRQGSVTGGGEILREFMRTLNWSDDSGGDDARVVSSGTTAAAILVAVLARAGRPLERKQLVEAAAGSPFEVVLKPSTVANGLAALTNDPANIDAPEVFEAIFQVGHGLYACHAALPFEIDEQRELAQRVADHVLGGRRSIRVDDLFGDAYQWHCADLIRELVSAGRLGVLAGVEAQRRWYLLDAILRYHRPQGLVNLQKGYWMERIPGLNPQSHEKVDQNRVVAWVLEREAGGGSMPIAEVRERVQQVQSLGATGQLQIASQIPDGSPIVKAGRGMLKLRSS